MERKTCLETDSTASVCVRRTERERRWERESEKLCVCVFILLLASYLFVLFFPRFFFPPCSLCGYLLSWSVWSWCPPSGMRIACISEYFHLRLHLLKSADKCIYIIYTNSGRVKAGLTHLQTGGQALQAKLQVRTALLCTGDQAGLCDQHPYSCAGILLAYSSIPQQPNDHSSLSLHGEKWKIIVSSFRHSRDPLGIIAGIWSS